MAFPEARVSDTVFQDGLLCLEHWFKIAKETEEKIYTIIDLTRVCQLAPASQRKYAMEWISRTRSLQVAAGVGCGQVTPSAILRAIMTAVYWVQPPPTPLVVVSTLHEAYVEAIKAFDAARVPLGAAQRAALAMRKTPICSAR